MVPFGSHLRLFTTWTGKTDPSGRCATRSCRCSQQCGWEAQRANVGLPVIEAPGITKAVEEGQELVIDIRSGTIENLATGRAIMGTPLPDNMLNIIEAGGLVNVVRRKLGLDVPRPKEEDADVVEL